MGFIHARFRIDRSICMAHNKLQQLRYKLADW